MKLLRFGDAGSEKPGMLDAEGNIRDLSGFISDIDASTVDDASIAKIRELDPSALPLVSGNPRIGPCIGNPGKFVCIGLNYSDHAKESGLDIPTEPVVFMKATNCIVGPDDDTEIPRGSVKTDWEVELGFVMAKDAKYVDEADALDYVAGYCVVNDISEREFQIERGGQWVKGKSCDTFGPVGPWLVTRDEVPDPGNLSMYLDVNGSRMQDGHTRTMIFSIAHIIHYLSQHMSLQAGDIITTGTPPGVGLGMKPPTFLKAGDVVELGIEGLGDQKQTCVAAAT